MNDDDLLRAIRTRADELGQSRFPCAGADDITVVELALGFPLPPFYVRLLREVGNGGFGPGYGISGVPPGGFQDTDMPGDLLETYRAELASRDDPAWGVPPGLLRLCNWGCAQFSYIDGFTSTGRVITQEVGQNGVSHFETAASLAGWLGEWVKGVDLGKEMYETVSYREGKNPFTGAPTQFPVKRMKGPLLDLSDRLRADPARPRRH